MNFWHECIDKQGFRRHCDPAVSRDFLQAPKDVSVCSVLIYIERIRGFTTMRYINLRLLTYLFTYLLTYLPTYPSPPVLPPVESL